MRKNVACFFISIFLGCAHSDQFLMPPKGFAYGEWNAFRIVLGHPCGERGTENSCQIVISKYQSDALESIADIAGKRGDTITVRYKMDKDPKSEESIAKPFGVVYVMERFNPAKASRPSARVKFYSKRK